MTARDHLLRLMAGAVASLPMAPAVVGAKAVVGVDLNGRIAYSTNPFLSSSPKTGAARVSLTVAPYIEVNSARSQMRLTGEITHGEYSRIYADSTDYSLNLNYNTALTSRFNMHAQAGFASSASGNFRPEAVDVTGAPSFLPNPTDVTLIGSQDRRNNFRGAIGASYTPDPRNTWTLDYSGAIVRLPDTIPVAGVRRGEFNSVTQDVGYSRTINSRLSAGASMGVNRIDYLRTTLGDAVILSPNINASMRLSSRWRLSAGVGMTFLRQVTIFGKDSSRSIAGNLSACRIDTRDSFCLNGSRSFEPSSLGSARKATSIGATYTYRLSSRDELSFSGNYSRSEETFFGPNGSVDFYGGTMAFRRQFTNRFAISADAGFNRSKFATTRADAYVGLGISYHLDNR